jgi:hypothetical protein
MFAPHAMRTACGFVCLALATAAAGQLAPQQAAPLQSSAASAVDKPAAAKQYRIAGTVVNSVSGEPVPRATVAILSVENHRTIASLASDTGGRFSLEGIPAGKYSLTVSKRGYITAFYDEHEVFSSAIVTGEGQDTEDIVFRLDPAASIEIEVTDDGGDPVEGADVLVFQRMHNFGVGERILETRQTKTDDTGKAENYNLHPCELLVAVSAKPWFAMHAAAKSGKAVNPALDVAYPITFYDGVTDEAAASPIVLAAGSHEKITISLHAVPALHLFVPVPQSAEDDERLSPTLHQSVFGARISTVDSNTPESVEGGTAEFVGVAPGHYELLEGDPPRITEVNATGSQQLSPAAGAPAANIQVKLRTPMGAEPPGRLRLVLTWADRAHPRAPIEASADGDGREFEAVPAGVWELWVSGDDRLLPVSSITVGGQKHAGNRVTVTDHSLKLAVTVVPAESRVEGFARKNDKGLAGVMVVLVPRDPEANGDQFRRDQSDSDGSFSLRDLAPGEYTVVAIEDGWKLDWARPEVIAPYLPKGVSVKVTESSGKLMHLSEAVPVQSR